MAKKEKEGAVDQEQPAGGGADSGAPAATSQAEQPAPPQEGACEVLHQDEDRYFVRYTWGGAERSHNVRRSSLQRKVEEDRQALQVAEGEERQRVEGLLQLHEYLLSRLPAA